LEITATQTATITTTSTASAKAYALGLSISGGGATATATITTTTKAYADPVALSIGRDLRIDAINTSSATTTATGHANSGALIAISGAATSATSTVKPEVASWLSGYSTGTTTATAGRDITVAGTLAATATATATAGTFATSGSAAGATATATIEPKSPTTPTVKSAITGGRVTSTAGTINVTSYYNTDTADKVDNGTGASAAAYASSGGIVVGSSGATATATDKPYLDSFVDSDVTLSAGSAITLVASSRDLAKAVAAGKAGGIVGLGRSRTTATASGTVKARMDGAITSGTDLTISALGSDQATATSTATSGGVAAVSRDNTATGTVAPNLDAHIGAGSVVDVSRAITILANNSPEADATTKGVAKGLAAIGGSSSTVTVTPIVTAYIGDGSLVDAGSVSLSAIAQPAGDETPPTFVITAVDPTLDTLTVSNHGVTTGDVIEYRNGCNLSGTCNLVIGGLAITYAGTTDARQYNVLNVTGSGGALDEDRFALGASFNAADIDATRELISFALPHNLVEGESVVYRPDDPLVLVGGLTAGQAYTVHVVDERTIQLDVAGAFLKKFEPGNLSTDANGNLTVITIAGNGFTDHQAVTYVAPDPTTFLAGQVNVVPHQDGEVVTLDPATNNIYFFDADGNGIAHGFTDGTLVRYSVDGTVIGGLIDGTVYEVDRLDAYQVQLRTYASGSVTFTKAVKDNDGNITQAAKLTGLNWTSFGFVNLQPIVVSGAGSHNGTYTISSISGTTLYLPGDPFSGVDNATHAGTVVKGRDPIVLSPAANSEDLHGLIRAGDGEIGGLDDGKTYYVIPYDAASGRFQLTATAAGTTPITLSASGLTSTTDHWIGPQFADLSASSGQHQLRLNLTSSVIDTTYGSQTVVGPGGVSLAVLLPPPGDGFSTAKANGSGGAFYAANTNTSTSTSTATVTAYIGSDSLTTTGDVAISAQSETNARATASNDTGGFIGTGDATATTSQSSTTKAYLADGTTVGAGGNVTITAESQHSTEGSAKAKAKGGIGLADASMTSAAAWDTQATLGAGAKIVAAGNVTLRTTSDVP
ncbi:MAG: hypothetical protein WCF12_08765, partial [Propionicimonas sp.]